MYGRGKRELIGRIWVMPLSGLEDVLMRQEIQWCFVSDLSLHGFSQPPTLMCMSHKLSLLCTVTYLCITVVANSLSKKSYVQEEVTC